MSCFILKGIERSKSASSNLYTTLFHPQRNWKCPTPCTSASTVPEFHPQRNWKLHLPYVRFPWFFLFHPQRNWKLCCNPIQVRVMSFVSSSKELKVLSSFFTCEMNVLRFILKGIERKKSRLPPWPFRGPVSSSKELKVFCVINVKWQIIWFHPQRNWKFGSIL